MKPLKYYEDLVRWSCPDDTTECCNIYFNERRLQEYSGLPITKTETSKSNKILFCHDMNGGYSEDNFINDHDKVLKYRCYHWNLMDIFVYFSHHFVTIPPRAWTHLAHKHGVQCLGTLLIEPGIYESNFTKMFDTDKIDVVADKLDEIRKFYKFDGWLVNIESRVKDTDGLHCQNSSTQRIIGNICALLSDLRARGNVVVWYDAITKEGSLVWQNCLNEQNRLFFEHSGNIFTNYTWTEQHLETSLREAAGQSERVFVGIDCFGRGCHGGGGFKCCDALEMVKQASQATSADGHGLSVALFAHGWCYEMADKSQLDEHIWCYEKADKSQLDEHVWQFFHLMAPYLHPTLGNRTVYRQLPEMRGEKDGPFVTTFDLGQGWHRFEKGVCVEKGVHNDLMGQEVALSGLVSPVVEGVTIKVKPCRHISYNGYSCMVMTTEVTAAGGDLEGPISVEILRLGWNMSRGSDASVDLWLGQGPALPADSHWSGISLRLTFSGGHSELLPLEYVLDSIMEVANIVSGELVHWYNFKVDRIRPQVHEDDDLALRKVELIIADYATLYHLQKSAVYFGQFKIEISR